MSPIQTAAWRTALIYAVVAGAWVALSDRLLAALVSDPLWLTRLQTIKGGLFVLVTAVVVYLAFRHYAGRFDATRRTVHDSEEQLRSVVDTVVDGIVTIDDRGTIMSFNPSAEKIFGYRSDEVVGRKVATLMPEPYSGEHDDAMNRYLQSGDAKIIDIGREVVGLRKDGSTFPMDLAVSEFHHHGRRMFTGIVRDITERKVAEQELQLHQVRLRSLTSELSSAEERERRQVAVDLHDHIGQTLAIAKIKLGALKQAAADGELAEPVSEIRDLVSRSIDSTRSLTFELGSPILYELGLVAAIENLVKQAGKAHGLDTRFEDDGQDKPLSDDLRIVLFRAVRELLTNVGKHAKASEVQVRVWREDANIRIRVEDDGQGFDVPESGFSVSRSGGFGLFNVSERLDYLGERFGVESARGRGAIVDLTAPLSDQDATSS